MRFGAMPPRVQDGARFLQGRLTRNGRIRMFMPPRALILFVAMLVGVALPHLCEADPAPATPPATLAKTGEFYRSFTFRDHLSAPSQIAARLKLDEKEMGGDYNLSDRPFWIYVPSNYDPATPYGIIVYLGYKDSLSTPPLWQ